MHGKSAKSHGNWAQRKSDLEFSQMSTNETSTSETLRSFLLGIFLFGLLGTGAELLLIEHTEEFWQLVPLFLMGLCLPVLVWLKIDHRPAGIRIFQGTMILFVVSGLIGLWQHYNGNVEFELEMYPSLQGWRLFWKALKGATPVLAPGAMSVLGLLGLGTTYRHPDLKPKSNMTHSTH